MLWSSVSDMGCEPKDPDLITIPSVLDLPLTFHSPLQKFNKKEHVDILHPIQNDF